MCKMHQLYEQIETRFGIVLIGPSGSGKSTIWQVLQKAIEFVDQITHQSDGTNKQALKINTIVINPKSLVPRFKLFGYIDEDTREWHDGLFSNKARELQRATNETNMMVHGSNNSSSSFLNIMNWIIFDGDIDPDWVEALNSVLDDNRVLTLPSGERIDFDVNRTRILFETTTLSNVSPATISRLGVVSIDSSSSSYIIHAIVQQFAEQNKLSPSLIPTVQAFLHTNQQSIVSMLSTTRTLLEHLHYAAMNHENESQALDRMTGGINLQLSRKGSMNIVGDEESYDYNKTDSDQQVNRQQRRINHLILTDSMSRCIEMLRPLVQYNNNNSKKHICLVGPVCSGKSTLISEFIIASSTANGYLVQVRPHLLPLLWLHAPSVGVPFAHNLHPLII